MRDSMFTRLRVLAVLVASVVWSSVPAYAIRDSEKALFGPVGAAAGQVVRVNVYGIGNPNDTPWSFLIRIFDARGTLVSERRLEVMPGVTGAADFRIGEGAIPPGVTGRRTLRAEIVGFNPQPDPPGEWFTTLEVINSLTGRTAILLGGPDTIPAPR